MTKRVILWFRQDLRLHDLPALYAAASADAEVLPVYIHDEEATREWAPGAASRWWLHHSLASLSKSIEAQQGRLLLKRGNTADILGELCEAADATLIHCTRRYEPWAATQEQRLYESLGERGINLKRFPGALLHEPGSVLTKSDTVFKVFTPFWRAARQNPVPAPQRQPKTRWLIQADGDALEDWALTPSNPNWAEQWQTLWQPGESGAAARLEHFLASQVDGYADNRNLPAIDGTSRLSPHLHFGELSVRQLWAGTERHKESNSGFAGQIEKYQAEMGWREFSYHLLHYFPHIPALPFKEAFGAFPWQPDEEKLHAWQKGQTGYPIVDAGMRELWQTGYMHNRVRMVVASFLCKHLLQHWRSGEDWFWDTLVDADLASNGCSWQWVAGSGADASPYFRIFNPVTQGEKFDKHGEYVRQYVPEIAALPNKYLHKPWEAPADVLEDAGITLGDQYPHPIVDHREARKNALDAYEVVKLSNAPAA